MSKQNLNIDYDPTADILYVSFGKPKSAISVEINDGDLIRIDAYTDKIVGMTIIDFKKRYMGSSLQNIEETANKVVPALLTQFKH